jgi:6-phosphogluconolactonase (cycloisomerase 2 family)
LASHCRGSARGFKHYPERQKGPHAHFIAPDPENDYALACDLGLDKVLVYRLGGGRALEPEPTLALTLKPEPDPAISVCIPMVVGFMW